MEYLKIFRKFRKSGLWDKLVNSDKLDLWLNLDRLDSLGLLLKLKLKQVHLDKQDVMSNPLMRFSRHIMFSLYQAQQPVYQAQQQVIQPVVAAAPKCHTGNCLARWNIEAGIGPVFSLGRNILTPSRTNNVPGTDFNSVSFGDAYETGFRAELGGSYALAPNTKVTLFGHYEELDSDGVQNLGTIGGEELTGALTDYESYGVELGLRQYFAPRKIPVFDSFRPYVEGVLRA